MTLLRKRASAALVQAQSLSILQPLASLAFRSSSCNTDQTHELTYRITEPTPAGSRQSQNESWPGATTWEDTSQSPNGLLRKNLLITSSEQVMERSFSPLGTFFHHLNDTQGLVLAPKEATHLEEEITVHVQVKWGSRPETPVPVNKTRNLFGTERVLQLLGSSVECSEELNC